MEKKLIHYCQKCDKKTEHYKDGERWVKYYERCVKCGNANYSEILRRQHD